MLLYPVMRSRFLPGFDHLCPNGRLITADEVPEGEHILRRDGRTIPIDEPLSSKLVEYRAVDRLVQHVLETEPLEFPIATNKRGLVNLAAGVLVEKLQDGLAELPHEVRREIDSDKLVQDAFAGVAQTAATIEVSAKVADQDERFETHQEVVEVCERSKGMLVHWSGLHVAQDAALTYAVAVPRPDLRSRNPHDGLTYGEQYFEIADDNRCQLDPDVSPHLKGFKGRHPNFGARPEDAWYGCPARRMIPVLYDGLLAAADEGFGIIG